MHFLLVDDDPALLLSLTDALHLRFGELKITVKTNADDALAFLRQTPVDLVISDMLMSDMDGCRLAEALQFLESRPPVILITGAINDAAVPRVVSRVVRKPFTMYDLDTAIRATISFHPEL